MQLGVRGLGATVNSRGWLKESVKSVASVMMTDHLDLKCPDVGYRISPSTSTDSRRLELFPNRISQVIDGQYRSVTALHETLIPDPKLQEYH